MFCKMGVNFVENPVARPFLLMVVSPCRMNIYRASFSITVESSACTQLKNQKTEV
jgi:hypothetical protein